MEAFQGDKLKSLIESALVSDFRERFLLKDLHNYMISKNNRRVCCLYGLRRTGKTVMAMQEIRNLDNYEHSLYVLCEKKDSIHQIKEVLNQFPDCKYLFIDEATKTEDFIDTSAFLADSYAMRGMKVVLSGTDSLGFMLAKNDELYDRVYFLHTTFIPYKEYNYLLGEGIKNYIRYGGTLTNGEPFYNKERTDEYTNTAIVRNIIHTLERWGDGINYTNQLLRPIRERGELVSFINKVIEYPTREFLASVINDDFRSHDLGSLCQLMRVQDIADTKAIKTKEMTERIRELLEIKEDHFNKADSHSVEAIIGYLKELDVLYQIPKTTELDLIAENEYIFTQVGMRYCQATALAKALVDSNEFRQEYTEEERFKILKKLKENISGGILEDVVFYQLAKDVDAYNAGEGKRRVAKYRNRQNQEIDVLILDYEEAAILAIEVKFSEIRTGGQRKHLLNTGFCAEIEENTGMTITNKIVVYLWEDGESEDGVLYINAENFLLRTADMVQVLLSCQSIASYSQLKVLIEGLRKGNIPDIPKQRQTQPNKMDANDLPQADDLKLF